MHLPLATWIARRYLWSRNAGRFAPLLTATAIASVAVGTVALIVIMSVMRGFKRELTDRLLGFNAHITFTRLAEGAPLSRPEILSLLQGFEVRDAAPFVQGEVIAQSGSSGEMTAQGARVRGIDPAEMGAISGISIYLPEGTGELTEVLTRRSDEGLPNAVIGSEVVGQLMVHPDFNDAIELTAPLAELTPSGDLVPNRGRFRVAGIFRAGIFDYDSKYLLLSLPEARRLLGEQSVEGWQVRLSRATDAPRVLAAIAARLPGGWKAEGVDAQNRRLFAALALERLAMGGILLMVLIIASCSIAGVVMLVVAAKRRDAAILESIGLVAGSVRRVFLLHAAFIGATGAAIGLGLGTLICEAILRWPIMLPDSYYLDFLPVELNPGLAAGFALLGALVAVAASVYPVHRAARVSPVEVLRYE